MQLAAYDYRTAVVADRLGMDIFAYLILVA